MVAPSAGEAPDLHDHEDEAIIQVRLDIMQRTGRVIFSRLRLRGRCQIILEDEIRFTKIGFPPTPSGWLRFVASSMGIMARASLNRAFRLVGSRQWKPKKHLAKHPFNRAKSTWRSCCDATGHRVGLDQLTDRPDKIGCLSCRRHPRFLAIWQGWRDRGATWAMADPDELPADETAAEISMAWEGQ